ncbi:hypothetical protein B0I12_002254 [Microbacterium hydrothermale]|nr:hypothetical protein [Microbacterium hydrothermale]
MIYPDVMPLWLAIPVSAITCAAWAVLEIRARRMRP